MSLPKALFEEFSSKLNEVIQSNPTKDIEKNIKSVAISVLSRMDLVTSDEFEIQKKMLQKMALKITELEQRIADLENQTTKKSSSATNKITRRKVAKSSKTAATKSIKTNKTAPNKTTSSAKTN